VSVAERLSSLHLRQRLYMQVQQELMQSASLPTSRGIGGFHARFKIKNATHEFG
jgi:hypothetical protein